MNVKMNSIVKGQTEQHSNEFKPNGHFIRVTVKPIKATIIFWNKHVQIRIEDLFGQKCKIFIFNSSLISPFLSNKLYLERTSQIGLHFS